jgi:hypothetical protein
LPFQDFIARIDSIQTVAEDRQPIIHDLFPIVMLPMAISELVPQAKVSALLANPNTAPEPVTRNPVQEVARLKGLQLPILKASTEDEIDDAFASLVHCKPAGLSSSRTGSSGPGSNSSWRWHHFRLRH